MKKPKSATSKSGREIPDSKSAERALRESAARMQALFETAVDGAILIDAHGAVLMFNPACEKLFGYAADEVVGKNVKMLMPEPYRDEHDHYIANYLDTRKHKIIGIGREVVGRRKDGSTFPMDLSVGEAKQEGGSIFVGIIRDITERKSAERALRESAARMQALFETAVDGAILIDAHGAVLMFNPACEKLFGYAADEVVGKNVKMLMPEPYRDEHDGYIKSYLDTRKHKIIGIGREVVGRRKDGSTFPMDLSVGEAKQEGGSIFVGIIRDITERKSAERALRESAARMQALFETAVDGAILIDAHGAVLMFNPACEKLFGYAADEVVGKNVKMLMPEPYRDEHDRYIASYLDTRKPKIIGIGREVVGRRKDGSIFVGIIRDITERKSAERALRESTGRMRALFETAVDGVILIDGRGTVLMFNPACERLFGYFSEEVVGKNVKMLMPEPYRHEHDGYVANYLDSRKPKIIGIGREVVGLRADGSTFPIDLSVGEAKHQGGGSIFVGIIRDITERRAALQALNESERSFRLLVEGVVDYALFMLDPHGYVANWNSGAERIKGYRADEIIGRHFSCFYTQEDQLDGLPAQALQKAAEQGKFESETWRVRKDGSRFWASVVIDPVRDETGALIGFVKITRDITSRKRAEADLQQARAELARVARVTTLVELTAAIAHEVHQPLTGLVSRGNASLRWLAAEPPNLDAARQSIERMVQAGARAGEVMGRVQELV